MPGARAVERRIVTVLFADLVGFTALSERMDPEDVALVQDAYFDAVRETVARHGGQLEKFIGDAAMAVFGAPRTRDDDAERAVRAGLALVAAVERLGSTLGLEERALELRVGVNSGETLYGEASAERGPVTGDVVNVAARLQAAAEPGSVVVGDVTALAVADGVSLERLAPLTLKGKAEAVTAFRVQGLHPERSRERALGGLRAPTLGRERELRRLAGALGDGARRILVAAPPGVGKSRLVSDLAATAHARGATVLESRVRPDALGPYEPVAQLLHAAGGGRVEEVLGAASLPPGRVEALAGSLDALRDPSADVRGDARPDRDALFDGWLEILDLLAGGRPALWVVEDAHWASPDLLAFLERARIAPSETGRLAVVTARPDLLEIDPAWCAEGEVLELAPLAEPSIEALVRALVGTALPDELVERIVERAGGNPLFVEELLRMWAGTGVLRHDPERGWSLSAEPDAVHLPPTVHAVYAGQLDDLAPAARAAARRFAVAGRRFPAAASEPLEIADSERALESLALRALVSGPHGDELLGSSFAFRHALLRDAGYASLAKAERAALHCRLAQWLADLPGDAASRLAEVIGRHYAAALDSAPLLLADIAGRSREDVADAAGEWFERAAAQAVRVAAWETARTLALRALEHVDDSRPLVRGTRLELLAEATANAVGADEAIALLDEALDAFRAAASADPVRARAGIASAGHALGGLLRAQTWFTRARLLAEELLEEIGPDADAASRARLLLLRALAILNASDDDATARGDAEQALELARAAADPGLELDAEHVLAQIASEQGVEDDEAWGRIEERARAIGRWPLVAAAVRARGALVLDESPREALSLFDRYLELAEARGLAEAAGWARHGRAEAHLLLGDWDDALAEGLAAVDFGESHGFHRVVVRSWFVLLPIARGRGRDDLVRQASARFQARRGREPDSPYARIVTTAVHLDFADAGLEPSFVPDVGERLASFDLAHGSPSWLAAVERVVGAWLDAGELAGVESALDRMAVSLERRPSSPLARATEATLRARLHLARHDGEAARRAARGALAVLGPGAPWWRLGALRALASAGGGDGALAEIRALEVRLGLPAA